MLQNQIIKNLFLLTLFKLAVGPNGVASTPALFLVDREAFLFEPEPVRVRPLKMGDRTALDLLQRLLSVVHVTLSLVLQVITISFSLHSS